MGINWTIIIIVGAALLALIIFMIVRNFRDEEDLEHTLKDDYKKSKDEESDIDVDQSLTS